VTFRDLGDVLNAEAARRLILSADPFPGYQRALTWVHEEVGGNWYTTLQAKSLRLRVVVCAGMLAYCDAAPRRLVIQADAVPEQGKRA